MPKCAWRKTPPDLLLRCLWVIPGASRRNGHDVGPRSPCPTHHYSFLEGKVAQHHTHLLLALGLALMPPLRPAIAQGGLLKGCPSVLC